MSEGSISIRKAVPIIAVAWILSLITTFALVYVFTNNSARDTLNMPYSQVSCIIGVYNSTYYYATNCTSSMMLIQSTNASKVINFVIGSLTNGGMIHLKAGTYTLQGPILFERGTATQLEWVLEGEGDATDIECGTSTYGIWIRNATQVCLRDFYMHGTNSNTNVVRADGSGAAEQSMGIGSKIESIHIENDLGSGKYAVYLENYMYLHVINLRVQSGGTGSVPLGLFANSSTGINYGNSQFDYLRLTSIGADCLVINCTESTTYMGHINFDTFSHLEMGASGAAVNGLHIGNKIQYDKFEWITAEGVDYGIRIGESTTTEGYQSRHNVFTGGYLACHTCGIFTGNRTTRNQFSDISITASTNSIQDTGSSFSQNVYSNMILLSGTLSPGGAKFMGSAGPGTFFTADTSFTGITNGTAVSIYQMAMTPTIVQITLSSQGYAWYGAVTATTVVVYFAGNITSTVSGSIYTAIS